jgi:hypothetical protein
MSTELGDQLYQTASEAFERLATMTPLPLEEAVNANGAFWKAARVDFKGPLVGTFRMRFYGGLSHAVAQALLEEPPSVQQEEDALKEMANVICGNLLPYIAGPKPLFKMNPPQIEQTPAKKSSSQEPLLAEACITFPEGHVTMEVFIEKERIG